MGQFAPASSTTTGPSGFRTAKFWGRATPHPLPRAVLFDMDGTLINSEPLWFAAEFALAAEHGAKWTHDDAMSLVGNSLPASAAIIRERCGLALSDSQILDFLLAHVTAAVEREMPWRPGAVALLAALRRAGVPCALVTASYRSFASVVVAASGGALTCLVSGDEVTRGKPDPESYLLAASRIGVSAADCVAVEDSPPGITSAMASGARTVGIPCEVPVPPRPGLSRLNSLTELTLPLLAAIAAGRVVDTLA